MMITIIYGDKFFSITAHHLLHTYFCDMTQTYPTLRIRTLLADNFDASDACLTTLLESCPSVTFTILITVRTMLLLQ